MVRHGFEVVAESAVSHSAAKLLGAFPTVVADYAERNGADCGYWYGERPCVSLLAGAAWSVGHLALEEFSGTKEYEDEAGEQDIYAGRIDLKVTCTTDKLPIDLLFEAKHTYSYTYNLPAVLAAARSDAARAAPRFSNQIVEKYAAVFNTVCLGETADNAHAARADWEADPEGGVAEILGTHRRLEDVHAIAWSFPESGAQSDGGYLYPGIVLSVSRV